jgi:hypothetical protein
MTRQIAMLIALVILIAFVVFAGPAACQKIRSLAAQGRVTAAQGSAYQNSAADAVATQSGANERQSESEATTRSNERTIRDAKGADAAVDPAVRDSGFASLCKRPSFRNSPTGKLRCAPASGVAKAR